MAESPLQPDTIFQLRDAVYPSFAMLAGMELDLFTPLAGGPLSAEQIADAVGVQAVKLRPLLYALVVAGLLTVQDGLFSNTIEAGRYLVRGQPSYLGGMHGLLSRNWRNLIKTAAVIRTGGPVEKYDFFSMPPDELTTFYQGLHPGTVEDARRLMEHHDFSPYNTLLDVGGGSGGMAITIAQANPHLKATVMDLPLVTPITRQFVEEANMAGRVEIMTTNAVSDRLSGSFDVVVARALVQVLSADDSRSLLGNLAAALNPGGVLHLIGSMLDNSRLFPQRMVSFNLVLLNSYDDGQAYTEQEYRDWLAEAGLVDFERVVLANEVSIVTARKPA
jgi:SAM-dependent methyltransferase